MTVRRHIATILFTDIVGSTEMAARLGDSGWRDLLREHHARVRRAMRRFGGEEAGTAGDGFLMIFESPANAIRCADAIRQAVREVGLEVRGGIHMGQVEWTGRDPGGITVHIGSRVSALATAGEILVSGTVRDSEVGSGFAFADRGRHSLKGVPGEWRIYEVTGVPAAPHGQVRYRSRRSSWRGRRALAAGAILTALAIVLALRGSLSPWGTRGPKTASIAVLPFENAGGGEEDQYFSDGIMEEILARLSKIDGLKVIARSSVVRYRDSDKSPLEVGDELGVSTILEGSVRRSSDRLRIAAELVDTRTGEALWSEIYDRDPEDVFAIQSDVAEKIAAALRTELSPAEREGLREPPTTDLEAYHLYLRGRYFWNTRTEEGLRKAVDYFRRAIDRDPVYARAYAGLADAWNLLGQWYLPSEEAFPLARDAALQALAIDSTLAEPRVALGYIAMEYEWDWPAAERWLESAVKLDPGYSTGHQYYGNYLRIMGRFDEAIAQGKAAVEIDPLSIPQQAELGYTYYYARRFDEAREQLVRTLEMDTTYAHAHLRMGQVLEQQARYAEAVREMRRAVELSDGSASVEAALAHALAMQGDEAEARRILQRLESPGERAFPPSYGAAIVHAALGEKDEAFAWLQRAYAARSPSMNSIRVHPWLDPLREDERFDELLRQMKLTGS
ncbi:MAG: tetratricopeptide repeat protein [Gemmatimonadota bacterium]